MLPAAFIFGKPVSRLYLLSLKHSNPQIIHQQQAIIQLFDSELGWMYIAVFVSIFGRFREPMTPKRTAWLVGHSVGGAATRTMVSEQ